MLLGVLTDVQDHLIDLMQEVDDVKTEGCDEAEVKRHQHPAHGEYKAFEVWNEPHQAALRRAAIMRRAVWCVHVASPSVMWC